MADLIEVASTEIAIGSPGVNLVPNQIQVASTEITIGSPGVNMVLGEALIRVRSHPIGIGTRGFRLREA